MAVAKKAAPKKAAAKAPAKAAAAKAAPAPTITMKHLGAQLAEDFETPKRQADAMLHGLVEMISAHLKKGDRVRLAGLGILQVKARPARTGRNPATGEAIKIKASKKVSFRVAKELKEAV
jgi:DNA-binding protein HU-beta